MKPATFDYHVAQSLEETLVLLRDFDSEAKILAGGQSLVPLMNMRLARPRRLVDINRVAELDYIRVDEGQLRLGALTRHRAIERSQAVANLCPLLSKAVRFLGHPQVRSRGTVGGSVAHADPAAEYPAVIAALGGEMVIADIHGQRVVGWRQFFVDHFTVDLKPHEMVVEIRLPVPRRKSVCDFLELSRRHGDFAIVEAAVQVELDEGGRCVEVGIGLGGVGAVPVRAASSEEVLLGQYPNAALIEQAAALATEGLDPYDDVQASSAYRKRMVPVLVARALRSALALESSAQY